MTELTDLVFTEIRGTSLIVGAEYAPSLIGEKINQLNLAVRELQGELDNLKLKDSYIHWPSAYTRGKSTEELKSEGCGNGLVGIPDTRKDECRYTVAELRELVENVSYTYIKQPSMQYERKAILAFIGWLQSREEGK